jgi:hypothetical protein
MAHRVCWSLQWGTIPAGGVIRHLCDHGHLGCVRPMHLALGTTQENAYDRVKHGYNGLTIPDVLKIRAGAHASLYATKGVSKKRISGIRTGRTYKYVGPTGEYVGPTFDLRTLDPPMLPPWDV